MDAALDRFGGDVPRAVSWYRNGYSKPPANPATASDPLAPVFSARANKIGYGPTARPPVPAAVGEQKRLAPSQTDWSPLVNYVADEVRKGGATIAAQAHEAVNDPTRFAKSIASGAFHSIDDPLQTVGKALRYPFTRSQADYNSPQDLAKAVLMGTGLKAAGPAGEAAVDAAAPVVSKFVSAVTQKLGGKAGAAVEAAANKTIGHAAGGATFMVGADPDHPILSALVGSVAGPALGLLGEAGAKGATKIALPAVNEAAARIATAGTALKRVKVKGAELPPQQASVASEVTPQPGQVNIVRMPVKDIVPDPSRFQYKQGSDAETGAGGELKGLSKYDEMLGGVISVWRDPQTGIVHPVNGHNRLALAQRTGHESVNVQELPATTAEEARTMGALANIAEGRGTALDAAQFFRNSGLGIDDLRDRVSFKGSIARNGLALSKLTPDLFDRVARGELSEGHGAAIGESLDTPELQRTAAKVVEDSGKRLSDGEVREVARQIGQAGTEKVNQETLFGTESQEIPLFVEKAQLASAIQKRLASDKRLFGFVAKEGRAEGLSRAGNVIDVEGSRRIADEAGQLGEVFSRLYTRSGPIADAIHQAARRIANGEKPGALANEVYPSIRAAVQEAVGGREGASNPTPGIGDQNGELATSGRGADAGQVDEGRVADSTDPSQSGFALTPEDFKPGTFREPRNDFEQSDDRRVTLAPAEPTESHSPERIEVHAIELPDGTVVEGVHHGDAIRRALEAGLSEPGALTANPNFRLGYVTSRGRFVEDGRETMLVAMKAGQLRRNTKIYRSIEAGHIPLRELNYSGWEGAKMRGVGQRDPRAIAPDEIPIAGSVGSGDRFEPRIEQPEGGEPRIVTRALKYADADGTQRYIALDQFTSKGRYLIDDYQPRHALEGYHLSDGSFITRGEAAERYGESDFGPEGRDASGPLFSPEGEADLFGKERSKPKEAEASLFDDRAGTPSSRHLEQVERGARSESEKLRQILKLETDPRRRAEAARQLAEYDKLLNRGKAITPEELATRRIAESAAEKESGLPHPGPDQGVLLSPAAQPTIVGARIRNALGIKNSNTGEVVALRKISLGLAEAVGVPLREGRGNLKRMRALGAFWTKSEVIRVRRLKALDTVSHEIGHYLSKKYGIKAELKLLDKAQRIAAGKELVKMGRDLYGDRKPNGGYGEEGVAQAIRFLVTDRQRLAAEAPNFTRYVDSLLEREPALRDVLNQAHDDWERYNAAPANAKIGSMIEKGLPARVGLSSDRLVDEWFNDLAPIKRSQEALGNPSGDITKDAYILARLTKGDAGRARDMLDNGVIKFGTDKRVSKGLREILQQVGEKNRDAFTEYVTARQVLTKTGQGIDTGFDVRAAQEVVDGGNQNPVFVKAADELWHFRSSLLEYMADAGLMTTTELQAIRKGNPTPTPFYRSFTEEEGTSGGPVRSSALARSSAGVYKMKGSDRAILDPLQSVVADAYSMVDRAHKHHAAATLLKTAIKMEGGGHIAELLPEMPMEIRRIGMDRVKQQLIDAGWTPPDDPGLAAALQNNVLEAFYEKSRPGARETRDHVLPVLIDGERRWIQVNDPATWDALQRMSVPEVTIYEKILSAPTRTLRMGATQANPDFALVNPFRDAFPAAIYGSGGWHLPGWHLLHGVGHLIKSRFGGADDLVARWAQSGGENSGMVGADKRTMTREYQRTVHDLMRADSKMYGDLVTHPIKTMRSAFEWFENGTRLGEFADVRSARMKQGASEPQASMEAGINSRDVTQDFFLAGHVSRVVNRYIPFFSAQMGDVRKLAIEFSPQNIATDAGRKRMATVTARAVAYITVPSLALYLAQKDDPDYQEIPEYYKANAWLIVDKEHGPIPFTTRSGKQTRIWAFPRPYLLGYVFGYAPEKMLAWVHENDPDALKDLAKQAWSAFAPPLVPTLLGPLIENYANKSLFTGKPIVPGHTSHLEPGEQVQPYTGEAARVVGKAVGYSPAKIENVVRGFTGGAGMTVKEIADAGIRAGRSVAGKPPLSAQPADAKDPLDRTPVIGRFILSLPGAGGKSVNRLYSDFEDAERKRQQWHSYLKSGQGDIAKKFFDANRGAILSVATAEDAGSAGELRRARKAMDDITADRRELAGINLPAQVKATKERELEQLMLKIARGYYARQRSTVSDQMVKEVLLDSANRETAGSR